MVVAHYVVYAAIAGLCGALSGVAVKIATAGTGIGPIPAVAVFVIFMAANAALTGQMWRFYLKGLSCGPTPPTMMTSTAVNMSVSACVGAVAFGEHLSARYWGGAALMVVGLALMAKAPAGGANARPS